MHCCLGSMWHVSAHESTLIEGIPVAHRLHWWKRTAERLYRWQDRPASEDDLLEGVELEERLQDEGLLEAALADPQVYADITDWDGPQME